MTAQRWLGLMVVVSMLLSACAHMETVTRAPAPRPESFVPLAVGNRWVYQTSFQGQPQPDLAVTIVKEEDGFFVDDRPTPSRLRYDSEGLRDGNVRYLLKAPVSEGEKWMSVADVHTVERYEIISMGKEIRAPAGVFSGCVTVRMDVRLDDKRSMLNEMTFAPGVGVVEILVEFKDGAKILPQSRMVLKSYQLNTN